MKSVFNNDDIQHFLMENVDIEYVQSGHNEYIKLSNGILICFGKGDFYTSFSRFYNLYRATLNNPFTFAHKFVTPPTIICATGSDIDYAYSNVIGVIRDTQKISSISLEKDIELENATVGVQYIAIGKWK